MDPTTLTDAEKAAVTKVDGIHSADNPQDPAVVVTPPTQQGFLGGKFKTAQDLEAAYKALQSQYTKVTQGKPVDAPVAPQAAPVAQPVTSPEITKAPTTEQTQEAVSAAGLDFNKYAQSIEANKGVLPDADYAELESKGIPRPMVDVYLKGLQSAAQDNFTRAYTAAGGEEPFNAARTWAAASLSDAELNAYNNAVKRGGADMELAVSGLVAKWRGVVGQEGTLVLGSGKTQASGGYESQREMVDAMKDPRYSKDAAYTRGVHEKVKVSNW